MGERLSLHAKLIQLLGSNNVYFQPPESIKLTYPCIVYRRSSGDTKFSNDMPYLYTQAYELTLIDKNPDSSYVKAIATGFPMIRYNRHYINDNLNHDVFTIYF